MSRIITACLISLCCGCGKVKPKFATDEEYKSEGWHSCARTVKNINGVKCVCWDDHYWNYTSNTVDGTVTKIFRGEFVCQ